MILYVYCLENKIFLNSHPLCYANIKKNTAYFGFNSTYFFYKSTVYTKQKQNYVNRYRIFEMLEILCLACQFDIAIALDRISFLEVELLYR